jgi:iron complex outermembrane recepter protein
MNVRKYVLYTATATLALVAAGSASAQETSEPQASEGMVDIVVTAEKRETSLQKTPLAITALSGETLAATQTRQVDDLIGRVPNLHVGSSSGFGQFSLRGIGSAPVGPGSESPVAVHVNGVYVSRPYATVTSFFDVASVEVLRGPQGTLYGRNATAGSVNISTVRPKGNELSGYVRLTLGNYNAVSAEAAIEGALVPDKLLIRLAGISDYHSGYGKNIVTGNDVDDLKSRAIRGTLVANLTDDLTATVIGEYYRRKDNSATQHNFGAVGLLGLPGSTGFTPLYLSRGGYAADRVRDIAATTDPLLYNKNWSAIADINWTKGDFQIRSISGYRGQDTLIVSDIDGGYPTAGYAVFGEPARQFSEELNASYTGDRIQITTGLYWFKERIHNSPYYAAYQPYVFAPTAPASTSWLRFINVPSVLKTTAKAAFAQGSFEVVDNLKLIGGIRYSDEKKDFSQVFNVSFTDLIPTVTSGVGVPDPAPVPTRTQSWNSWTPKVGIEFQASPQTLIYATFSKGFRSGNFDTGSAPNVPPLDPEGIKSYEAGLKTTLLDKLLRVNMAGFYYDYSNIVLARSDGTTFILLNGGKAEVYGIEAEITAYPAPNLQLEFNGSYTHSEFTSDYCSRDPLRPALPAVPMICNGQLVTNAPLNFKGNSLPYSPKYRLFGAVQYTFNLPGGDLRWRGEANYTSDLYFLQNNNVDTGQKGYVMLNAFLNYEWDENWHVGAFVKNITDKIVRKSYSITDTFGSVAKGSVGAPRTFGIELGYKF